MLEVRAPLFAFDERQNGVRELVSEFVFSRRGDEQARRVFGSALGLVVVKFFEQFVDLYAFLDPHFESGFVLFVSVDRRA